MTLPIHAVKDDILNAVEMNDTLLIIGETGSGKSTQIPQFISLKYPQIKLAVTQPRRVAAISLANRVSNELQSPLGAKVGYAVRFEECMSEQTKVKFMTDGMLLREFLTDPLLLSYSFILLDEAHERSLRTDLLFGLVKRVQKQRKETGKPVLKVLIMSATLSKEKFSAYFDSAPCFMIQGRSFPVRIFYTKEPVKDYLDAVLVTIFQIHIENAPGDILVFLTGQEEIEGIASLILENAKKLPNSDKIMKLIVTPIHSSLPSHLQAKVFSKTPHNCRKVILATNIAETSITIPGVTHVVDAGMVKMRLFNSKTGMEALSVVATSKASAKQRAGRAGRVSSGTCYRLFTEESFKGLMDETVPEILRCNLSNAILTMKASGISDIIDFDYLDRPSDESLKRALTEIYALGAIGNDSQLTKVGKEMAMFPLSPGLSRALLKSFELKCTEEVISIIAMLSVENVFVSTSEEKERKSGAGDFNKKSIFADKSGDHISLLNVFKLYTEAMEEKDVDLKTWCNTKSINFRSMQNVWNIRKQIYEICMKRLYEIKSANENYDLILKCFVCGFFNQIALRQPDNSYRTLTGNSQVYIHPSSLLFLKRIPSILYNNLTTTTKNYVKNVSEIYLDWLPEVNPKLFGKQ